jgi:hypothetical protein
MIKYVLKGGNYPQIVHAGGGCLEKIGTYFVCGSWAALLAIEGICPEGNH